MRNDPGTFTNAFDHVRVSITFITWLWMGFARIFYASDVKQEGTSTYVVVRNIWSLRIRSSLTKQNNTSALAKHDLF